MKKLNEVVLKEVVSEFWGDGSKNFIDKTILTTYSKSGMGVEVEEEVGVFGMGVVNYKTIVRVLDEGKLMKSKIFWVGCDKWDGFGHKELVNYMLN